MYRIIPHTTLRKHEIINKSTECSLSINKAIFKNFIQYFIFLVIQKASKKNTQKGLKKKINLNNILQNSPEM